MPNNDNQLQQLQQENVGLKAEIYDANRAANSVNQTLTAFAQGLAEKLGLDVSSESLLDDIYSAVPEQSKKTTKKKSSEK